MKIEKIFIKLINGRYITINTQTSNKNISKIYEDIYNNKDCIKSPQTFSGGLNNIQDFKSLQEVNYFELMQEPFLDLSVDRIAKNGENRAVRITIANCTLDKYRNIIYLKMEKEKGLINIENFVRLLTMTVDTKDYYGDKKYVIGNTSILLDSTSYSTDVEIRIA